MAKFDSLHSLADGNQHVRIREKTPQFSSTELPAQSLYHTMRRHLCLEGINNTRMWANAQRDGRPAQYRWCPLFNAAKFGWRPLAECRAVTLPRRETRWNKLGCPKLTKRSQLLVGRSSSYCRDMWRTYCCLTSFFPIVDTCLSCEDSAQQSCAMVQMAIFCVVFASCISSEQHAAHYRPAF